MEIQRLDESGKVTQRFYEFALQCCIDGIELWVDVDGYSGLYQVSNMGRVKSLDHIVPSAVSVTGLRMVRGKVLNHNVNKHGYCYFISSRFGKYKTLLVHRIQGIAFIPNPENKKTINHDDGKKTINLLTNLFWNTVGENNAHSYRTGLKKPVGLGKIGVESHAIKIVFQYDLMGNYLNKFYGTAEAHRMSGANRGSIGGCANGKLKTAGGFTWKYERIAS